MPLTFALNARGRTVALTIWSRVGPPLTARGVPDRSDCRYTRSVPLLIGTMFQALAGALVHGLTTFRGTSR